MMLSVLSWSLLSSRANDLAEVLLIAVNRLAHLIEIIVAIVDGSHAGNLAADVVQETFDDVDWGAEPRMNAGVGPADVVERPVFNAADFIELGFTLGPTVEGPVGRAASAK